MAEHVRVLHPRRRVHVEGATIHAVAVDGAEQGSNGICALRCHWAGNHLLNALRRLGFAPTTIAFESWPKGYPFSPANVEDLQASHPCAAKHCEEAISRIQRRDDLIGASAAFTAYLFMDRDGQCMRVRAPRKLALQRHRRDCLWPSSDRLTRRIRSCAWRPRGGAAPARRSRDWNHHGRSGKPSEIAHGSSP